MRFRPHTRPHAHPHAVAALLAAAALTIAACGGDEDPVAVPGEPQTEEPAVTRPPVGGPEATLSPDIPEQFDGGVAPVDVIGDTLPPLSDAATDPAVGRPAPVLVGFDLEGLPIRIDPANDGPAMVVFVAHWCPHCNDEIPKLNRMRADALFPEELDIVAVNTAVAPDRPNWPPDEWLAGDMDWRYPAMLDAIDMERETFVAADAYGVSGFPFVVLVDGDGTVVDRWSGEREREEILSRIDALTLA